MNFQKLGEYPHRHLEIEMQMENFILTTLPAMDTDIILMNS